MIAAECTNLWFAWAGMVVAWALAMVALFYARRTIRLLRGP
jgi:hypothetical protein